MAAGVAITPFRQYVLKVHSRCDLACDHCYVYEHADQTWRGRPRAMSAETATRVVDRIAEHAAAHAQRRVTVVLHGGEPLLFGVSRMRDLLAQFRACVPASTQLDLRIHTNAVRLDSAFLDLFLEFGVRVGVSLDGDRQANDLHRRFADGRTSHPQVLRGLSLLRQPQCRELYAGILCTVDVRNDPARVYQALAEQDPPRADLLLPHATWDHPPLRLTALGDEKVPEYAAWLGVVHDCWAADGRPFPIRTFDSIAAALRGLPSRTESLGLTPADLIVIETDGELEQADWLKTAYHGAAATGFDVFEHSFDEVAAYASAALSRSEGTALCATCRACPVVDVCGGGLYAHRYQTDNGFDNPSVYCEDLKALIEHVEHAESTRPGADVVVADTDAVDVDAHVLPREDFDVLASGYGDAEVIRRLAEPQLSIRRALLRAIGTQLAADSEFAPAWLQLVQLDETKPETLASVLADPYIRVWAVRLLAGEASTAPAELTRLAEIAASVALVAGEESRLPLWLGDGGVVHLPTIGALALGGPQRSASIETRAGGTALIRADGREYEVCVTGGVSSTRQQRAPEWRPQRRLTAGSWSVALEDLDPYRDCHSWPAAHRLSSDEAERWRRHFSEAVSYLDQSLPGYLPGLRAGLRTLMPMAPSPDGSDVSATARHAYGAVGVALPADGPTLALLLIREFQHVKLGAILDVYDLYDSADNRLYYAPWRGDARPLDELYQGTYAHLAVTEYWRARRHDTTGPRREAAEAEFARWRQHTAAAVETLLGSGSLTPLGERFVRKMRETVAPWLEEPVAA